MLDPARPLTRSRVNRMIAGVCGGIAEWLGWDPTVVRVIFILITALTGGLPGLVIYIVLWVVMPESPTSSPPPPPPPPPAAGP